MHPEAYAWVADHAHPGPVDVLDLGGRYVNGSPRELFRKARSYTVLDILDGPDVDVVGDAATWHPDRTWDVVVCCEVFEHTSRWPGIARNAYRLLCPGGLLIVTTAAPGRLPHSGVDGGPLRADEYYANIDPWRLRLVLLSAGFADITIDVQEQSADVRAVAIKPFNPSSKE